MPPLSLLVYCYSLLINVFDWNAPKNFLLEPKVWGGGDRSWASFTVNTLCLYVRNSQNNPHKSIITGVESFNKPFYKKSSLFFKDDDVPAGNIVDFPSGAVVTAPGDGGNQIMQHYHGGLSRDIQNRSFLHRISCFLGTFSLNLCILRLFRHSYVDKTGLSNRTICFTVLRC